MIILISDNYYGSLDPETGLSYTHIEFKEAVKQNRPILAFINKNLNKKSGDYENIKKFQDEILSSDITVDFFLNQAQLLGAIWPALIKHFWKNGILF